MSGGDNGSGEDPNRDRKKKSDPVDKKDDVDEEEDIVKTEKEDVVDEIQLPPVVPTAPTVHKFQHGGLPAAAAALNFGDRNFVHVQVKLLHR